MDAKHVRRIDLLRDTKVRVNDTLAALYALAATLRRR
jgi:hypothetical protein